LFTQILIAQTQVEKVYYYINDHLGTPQKVMDETGAVVWSADYEPFGSVNITTQTMTNPFRFPGQYHDSETGLHYNYFRYYDPGIGRYLRADPSHLIQARGIGMQFLLPLFLSVPQDLNLFSYSKNDPIKHVDREGLLAFPYHGFASLLAGLMEGHGLKSFKYAWDSMWTDYGTQSNLASDTNVHGMAGYVPGVGYQTPEQAVLGALERVGHEKKCGRHGSAMHTLQDLETPWHIGWQWRGNNPFTNRYALGHWFLDWVPNPITLKATYDAYKASRRYLQELD
jgi:RHS repeat-associated protein